MLRPNVINSSAVLTLGLYGSDSAGNPTGPELVGFTIPVLTAGTTNITFLPSSAFTLLQSSTYWLVASGTSPTPVGINWITSAPGITPTGIATSVGYRFSNTATIPPTGVSAIQNTYLVNATAQSDVPEPGTFTLWSLGCAGLLLMRRRAKKA